MADKKLAEQNLRWLRDARKKIADLHELAVNMTVNCSRETPEVDWATLEKRIAEVKDLSAYARNAEAARKPVTV